MGAGKQLANKVRSSDKKMPLNPGISDRSRCQWMANDSGRSQRIQFGVVALVLDGPEGLWLVNPNALRFSQ
ncbi:MAG: hypothetical protein JNM39_01000 [Bdellovibrionaceae bacterium]|nr:hypothetical protein [Pseudobdellovibrionaceae bacterium]